MKLTITTNEYEILKVPFNVDTVIIVHDFDITLLDEYKRLIVENQRVRDDNLRLAMEVNAKSLGLHDFDITLLDEYKTLVKENEKLKDDVLSLALAYDDCRNK